jgi:hypothetical protein
MSFSVSAAVSPEVSVLLEYHATSLGNLLPVFQNYVAALSSGAEMSKNKINFQITADC